MAKLPREYARAFRVKPGEKGKAYFINAVPGRMDKRIRAKMKRENRSFRGLILGLLDGWLNEGKADGGKLDDSETGSGLRGVQRGDDLRARPRQKAPRVKNHGEPGLPVSEGLAGRVAEPERDDSDEAGGEPVDVAAEPV